MLGRCVCLRPEAKRKAGALAGTRVIWADTLLCSSPWEATSPRGPPRSAVTESGPQTVDSDLIWGQKAQIEEGHAEEHTIPSRAAWY